MPEFANALDRPKYVSPDEMRQSDPELFGNLHRLRQTPLWRRVAASLMPESAPVSARASVVIALILLVVVDAGMARTAFEVESPATHSSQNAAADAVQTTLQRDRSVGLCPVRKSNVVSSLHELLHIVRRMPENSWKRVNRNKFSSVAQPPSLKPNCVSVVGHSAIINAWGGFAYDSNRGDLLTFGGGHADYCGNDVYRFRLSTLLWERAGISSQMIGYQASPKSKWALPAEGLSNAPPTAHMYDGLAFLPVADRMVYFGYGTPSYGGSGGPPLVAILPPKTGPWLFDPSRADPGKVVGSDGSAVDPAIPGGYMWENREYARNHPDAYLPPGYGPQTASIDTVCSGGIDAIFMRSSGSAGVSSGLVRYDVFDVRQPARDRLTVVGAQGNHMSQADMAVDIDREIAVLTGDGARFFTFWDLKEAGPRNSMRNVGKIDDPTGEFRPQGMGMDFDPVRRRLVLWDGESKIWELHVPEGKPTPTAGWKVSEVQTTGGPVGPLLPRSGGANGKWKYAAMIDVFLGLRSAPDGDVWIFKPHAWVDPLQER